MTKNRALNNIPKTHTIKEKSRRRDLQHSYSGRDKKFKRSKTSEIERWLADGYFFGNENPVELAREWQIYCQNTEF